MNCGGPKYSPNICTQNVKATQCGPIMLKGVKIPMHKIASKGSVEMETKRLITWVNAANWRKKVDNTRQCVEWDPLGFVPGI